jgi:imidazolonepropionase-like amidohydrolase
LEPVNVNLIVRGKQLVDGTGSASVLQGLVAITGQNIAYAGPAAGAPEFPNARIIDLPEATLLPGLIDMHAHPSFYLDEPDSAPYTRLPEGALIYSPITIALMAVANLRVALMSGVTSVRDTGGIDTIMTEVKRAIDKGQHLGSKVYISGRLITPTAGHCHYYPGLSNQADGPDGFRRAVREELRGGADQIKLAVRFADVRQEELNAAVDEAHRLGKKVACHTIDAPAERMAIEAGVDTFEHGTPTEEEIDLALEKGITWTPTVTVFTGELEKLEKRQELEEPEKARQASKELAEAQENMGRRRASIGYALQVGLRLAAGTDCWASKGRDDAMARELRDLVAYGCSPMQALQAATGWAAEAMGWDRIGTLKAGKLADLIAVPGDPLADIGVMRRVPLVVREGVVVKNKAE